MIIETSLQYHLFTGELVDNRTDYQKRLDAERRQPKQQDLFSTQETGQFQRNVRPWLNNLPGGTLTLEIQDVRSEEERDRERMKAAEELTEPIFGDNSHSVPSPRITDNLLISKEAVDYRVALFHLGKAELLECRPDLTTEIEHLKETDLEAIALQAEDALRAIYLMVLRLTLVDYVTSVKVNSARVLGAHEI